DLRDGGRDLLRGETAVHVEPAPEALLRARVVLGVLVQDVADGVALGVDALGVALDVEREDAQAVGDGGTDGPVLGHVDLLQRRGPRGSDGARGSARRPGAKVL